MSFDPNRWQEQQQQQQQNQFYYQQQQLIQHQQQYQYQQHPATLQQPSPQVAPSPSAQDPTTWQYITPQSIAELDIDPTAYLYPASSQAANANAVSGFQSESQFQSYTSSVPYGSSTNPQQFSQSPSQSRNPHLQIPTDSYTVFENSPSTPGMYSASSSASSPASSGMSSSGAGPSSSSSAPVNMAFMATGPVVQSNAAAFVQPIAGGMSSGGSNGQFAGTGVGGAGASTGTTAEAFAGNVLFWTSRDLRDTTLWVDESPPPSAVLYAGSQQAKPLKRRVEIRLATPKGYATQTRTTVQLAYGGGGVTSSGMPPSGPPTMEDLGRRGIEVAQFVWASPTALGTCRLSDGTEFPMVKFVSNGRDVLSTRFPVRNGKSVRYFEWRRDPKEKLVFTLCDLEGRAWAQYVGGPFGNKLLSPYLTYYWTNDDALLLHCVLAITIRRWSDQYP